MDHNSARAFSSNDMGYLVTNISYGIRQYVGKLIAEYDLTYPQSRVLARLYNQRGKEDVNQRDLEYALGIKASSVSSLVRNLEQKGLIRSERMPTDTRNKRITLTEKGLELQSVLGEVRTCAEEKLVAGLDEKQMKLVRGCLMQMLENLNPGDGE